MNTRQIDTESIEAACLAEVETVKTAANVPESARLCLGAMLRAIMANRIGEQYLYYSITPSNFEVSLVKLSFSELDSLTLCF